MTQLIFKRIQVQLIRFTPTITESLIRRLPKKNGRDIYTDGNHYSLDSRHGTFEVLDKKGRHQGEIDFAGRKRSDADKTGQHDIEI